MFVTQSLMSEASNRDNFNIFETSEDALCAAFMVMERAVLPSF